MTIRGTAAPVARDVGQLGRMVEADGVVLGAPPLRHGCLGTANRRREDPHVCRHAAPWTGREARRMGNGSQDVAATGAADVGLRHAAGFLMTRVLQM